MNVIWNQSGLTSTQFTNDANLDIELFAIVFKEINYLFVKACGGCELGELAYSWDEGVSNRFGLCVISDYFSADGIAIDDFYLLFVELYVI